ncbi:hypothetical protein E2562_013617 [Oryza meyeriana var. granulata]|uniref:DUF834 domain-containing protein n=1 Tax=Oryza meyeriana var. granulata TaxID=110450 RepID=A0A6G1C4E9_9ORYZ|nr:hypothetical protein E2562_013617 [Oryza meyeriana var. granulata]
MVRPGTGSSRLRRRGGDNDGGTDDAMATWGKMTRRRRRPISEGATTVTTVTRQDGLDGKKSTPPMGTQGSLAALDCGDGNDSSSAGMIAQ